MQAAYCSRSGALHTPPCWDAAQAQVSTEPLLQSRLVQLEGAVSMVSPEEDEADSPELAQPSHPAACLPQGLGQDVASMGVLGMGNQAADWVQQEAQYLHPSRPSCSCKAAPGEIVYI